MDRQENILIPGASRAFPVRRYNCITVVGRGADLSMQLAQKECLVLSKFSGEKGEEKPTKSSHRIYAWISRLDEVIAPRQFEVGLVEDACSQTTAGASTDTLRCLLSWLSMYHITSCLVPFRGLVANFLAISSSCLSARRTAFPCPRLSSSTFPANMTNIRICSSKIWRLLMLYDGML